MILVAAPPACDERGVPAPVSKYSSAVHYGSRCWQLSHIYIYIYIDNDDNNDDNDNNNDNDNSSNNEDNNNDNNDDKHT